MAPDWGQADVAARWPTNLEAAARENFNFLHARKQVLPMKPMNDIYSQLPHMSTGIEECVFGTEWMRSAPSTYLGIEKHGSLEDTTVSMSSNGSGELTL
jgi:hypothetical protein